MRASAAVAVPSRPLVRCSRRHWNRRLLKQRLDVMTSRAIQGWDSEKGVHGYVAGVWQVGGVRQSQGQRSFESATRVFGRGHGLGCAALLSEARRALGGLAEGDQARAWWCRR